METGKSSKPQLLQFAAYAVIVGWGIHAAAHFISVVLLALLMAYIYVPVVQWIMRRFRLGPAPAMFCTAGLIVAAYVVFTLGAVHAASQFAQKLPDYEARLFSLLTSLAGFLTRHGYIVAEVSTKGFLGTDLTEMLRPLVPAGLALLSDRLLIAVLTILFTAELVDESSPIGRWLSPYSRDVQRFITITAQSGAINSLGNLIVYLAFGVDFPVFWAVVYFFSNFIPNVGFILSLTPPILLTLLMHGWRKAILVFAGVMIMELFTDYYLHPRLMTRGLHISFLEVMLSLVLWGSLLGAAGALLGVPLTLAVRTFLGRKAAEPAAGSGG